MKNNACPPPPNDLAKVSNEQRKEKEVKRQDWKRKRRAHSRLLDEIFCSVECCHYQSTGRKGKGTEFIKQGAQNLPAMQETLVRFLGQEDPLEKG